MCLLQSDLGSNSVTTTLLHSARYKLTDSESCSVTLRIKWLLTHIVYSV